MPEKITKNLYIVWDNKISLFSINKPSCKHSLGLNCSLSSSWIQVFGDIKYNFRKTRDTCYNCGFCLLPVSHRCVHISRGYTDFPKIYLIGMCTPKVSSWRHIFAHVQFIFLLQTWHILVKNDSRVYNNSVYKFWYYHWTTPNTQWYTRNNYLNSAYPITYSLVLVTKFPLDF